MNLGDNAPFIEHPIRQSLLNPDLRLPYVDGTLSATPLLFTNIGYLTDWCREVHWWSEPILSSRLSSWCVESYRPYDYNLNKQVLEDIHSAVKHHQIKDDGESWHGPVNLDWVRSQGSLPIYKKIEPGMTFPVAEFLSSQQAQMEISCVCNPLSVQNVPYGNDIRAPYYDLNKFRRFFLKNVQAPNNGETWSELQASLSAHPQTYFQTMAPVSIGTNNNVHYEWINGRQQTTYSTGAEWPYIQASLSSGEIYQWDCMSYANGGWILILNEYNHPVGNTNDRFLPQDVNFYIHWLGSYTLSTATGGAVTYGFEFLDGEYQTDSKVNGWDFDYLTGMWRFQMTRSMLYAEMMAALAWLQTTMQGQITWIWIGNPHITVDSGEITNFLQTLPEEWNWQPSNGNQPNAAQ